LGQARGLPRELETMAKIKIDASLFDRAKRAAEAAGYSSVEEFIAHCIEKELQQHETDEAEKQVTDQLRGLGYIE
jgi:hypothetical protein